MTSGSFSSVITAIAALSRGGRHVGRTHIHKFLFLAEGWNLLPQDHPFALYLHGPYSRELDGELLALRAAGIITAEPEPSGFGARYLVAARYLAAAERWPSATRNGIGRVGDMLGVMAVRELEAVSTSEFVRRLHPGASGDEIVSLVRPLKPHLVEGEIKHAILKLEKLRNDVEVRR